MKAPERSPPSGPDGVLVIDKQRGPTSHDVVMRVRRALHTRRVGHAGTLDPMATGVLVVAVGEGTKLVPYLTSADKRYEATLRLGTATDSLDADGRVTREAPVPKLELADVARVAATFLGTQQQRAPLVSAVRVDGERLYERARRGEAVEAPLREVTLLEVQVDSVEGVDIRLRVHAGKGFYVRAFARDLAERLGTVGHLVALRRTASGAFTLDDAAAELGVASLMSVRDAARRALPVAVLDEPRARDVRHGRPIAAEGAVADVVALEHAGELLAVARRDGELLRVQRGFVR